MKQLNRHTAEAKTYTEKVIQFGEGNFLRAFVDDFFDIAKIGQLIESYYAK